MTGAGCLILRNESPEEQMEARIQADAHDNAVAQKFKKRAEPFKMLNLNFIEHTYISTFIIYIYHKINIYIYIACIHKRWQFGPAGCAKRLQ